VGRRATVLAVPAFLVPVVVPIGGTD